MTLAWMTTAIWVQSHREGGKLKVPDLNSLLHRGKAQPQSAAQQRQVLEVLSAQYGIPLQMTNH